MTRVTRLVLDVLKPRKPNALGFAQAIADQGLCGTVNVVVEEVDDQTETLLLTLHGDDLRFDDIVAAVSAMGGSLHSIDEVEVRRDPESE